MRRFRGIGLPLLLILVLGLAVTGWETRAASKINWQGLIRAHQKPDSLEDHLVLGIAYANTGEIEKGSREFEIIGKADYEKFSREIIRKAEARLDKEPDDILALNYLAFAYYARNDYARSRTSFQKLVRLDSGNIWSHNYLAIVYARMGDIDAAISQLKTSLKIEPKNQYTHLLLGMAYMEKGDYVKAAKEYAQAPSALKVVLKLLKK